MSTSSLRRQMKNIVHNYSEAEIKVREATSNDPWGPSSSLMSEIADLTYNVVAFSEIMSMIWKRLNDHGKNWRHVYKVSGCLRGGAAHRRGPRWTRWTEVHSVRPSVQSSVPSVGAVGLQTSGGRAGGRVAPRPRAAVGAQSWVLGRGDFSAAWLVVIIVTSCHRCDCHAYPRVCRVWSWDSGSKDVCAPVILMNVARVLPAAVAH